MKNRSAENEKLDNLSLQGATLHGALQSLEWINRWFGNHQSVVKSINRICRKEKKTVSVIDLGCGGGDLIAAVAKAFQDKQIPFSILGIDGNSHTLQYAKQKCRRYKGIHFLQADILNDKFNLPPCDILISSHFMYHFTEDGLIRFLGQHLPNTSTAVIFSELERHPFAMFLFKFFSFVLPISKLAKADGLLAIQRSFTKKEWLIILQKAGVKKFSLRRVPFFRIQLIIFPDQNK